ncbi:ClpP/crotonase-like domain-containing protein [Aspergillus oleicola]
MYGTPHEVPGKGEQLRRLRKLNHGFGDVQSLPRDIAMIEIRGFVLVHWEGVRENIDGKMSSVANAYALIIDLRENRGGDLETVALIASYLMGDDATVWLAKKNPSDGLTQNIYTTPVATEKRLSLEKPIFILTSSQTISGGEDIAYGLQVRERAKVVGEKTAGAANLPRACALNDNFVLFVPHMQAISPVTRSSWEGVGVVPDVEVSTELAFYTAQRLAREKTEVSV